MSAAGKNKVWRARLELDIPEGISPAEEILWPLHLDPAPSHTLYEDPAARLLVLEVFLAFEPDTKDVEALSGAVADYLGIAVPPLVFKPLAQRDWVRENQKSLKVVEAGRFFIHGSHYRGAIPAGKIPILIDATLAFGTGYHETTRCCLRALDALADKIFPRAALDLGCGSGILAFAIEKTWPEAAITATDMDDVAIGVARGNAEKNGIKNTSFAVAEGFAHPLLRDQQFDLITANILADPLIWLAPKVQGHLAPRGMVALSGLLLDQQTGVLKAYENQGLKLIGDFTENDWTALVLQKA